MTSVHPVRQFGDGAVVVDTDSLEEAHGLAAALGRTREPGVEDVIVGFRSVTVVIDPMVVDIDALREMVTTVIPGSADRSPAERIEIPVAIDGPDLDEVARLAARSPARVAELLTGSDLRVAFVGFAPGFAYLVGLDPSLAAVPRRSTPRPSVPGGSVALAGGFAGIYPRASPGGWQLIGRTDMALFDPYAPPYSVLQAGDLVRFRVHEVDTTADAEPATPARFSPLRSDAERRLLVEEPGWLTLVQDLGRSGVAGLGVPRAGAADPYGLRMANRLVGNDEDAAAIEATARGPSLRFMTPAHVTVVGAADVDIDGRAVPHDTIVPVDAGQAMKTGAVRHGLRAYIAVGGGIDLPLLLGSRSSDVLCGLGAGPLIGGDVLGLGPPRRPRGRARPSDLIGPGTVLRVMVGPDPFPPTTVERLLATAWKVDGSSDRIGVRFQAATPSLDASAPATASQGMITGAIQLPPDGRPIALLCDHATVGGYPVIATIVTADLGILGQLRPGETVRFDPVDLVEAVRARAERERALRHGVVGWYPVRSD